MNLLAIETTGPFASVALINENKELYEVSSGKERSHLESLIPMIDEVLKKSGLQIGDVTHIAASEGPGSFTGIRIGVSTARALAQSLTIPVISVPTLSSFIYNDSEHRGFFCPVFDARREQIYGACFYREDDLCHTVVPSGAYAIEEYLDLIENADPEHQRELLLFGDGLSVYGEKIKEWGRSVRRISAMDDSGIREASEDKRNQKASAVAEAALSLWKNGEVRSYEELLPVYLRQAEAQRKLEERLALEKA